MPKHYNNSDRPKRRPPPRPPGIFGHAYDRLRDRGKVVDEETDRASGASRKK